VFLNDAAGLVRFVDETVKAEQASDPERAIYLMGESFGGVLALAVAARNPEAYLHLVLVNPGKKQSEPDEWILP
jgi:pimeloyl-ACP methyl ester carboxylesterase